ncbi:hypothetical protein A1O7_06807 [Cladophialophora yegresii CBS 114405]|uniref:Uncharacterized protein n=1 Tax=Cladophialophora yegresii CBS 114405 TaxID=1182544 RepID=W9VLS9_9EURO|nr:uncharacterized protein A1O7_06807 [Cladophialophora yegresii CBS 114405]EXJ56463.1 hypothetical protein A1O7_06807 [Cladophialophora yegresii CBS 114405]
MCFSSNTIDDPTQPPMRVTGLFGQRVSDPTQQPIHITKSEDTHSSQVQASDTQKRKGSRKNSAAFVDVTDEEPKPITRKKSDADAETAHSDPKRNAQKNWRGRSSNPATFGFGLGADFGATPA